MKKIIFTLVGISFLIFSCQNELLDLQESSLQSESFSSSQQSGIVECNVIDVDRCGRTDKAISSFWWPSHPTNWNDGFFGTVDGHKLKFTQLGDGTTATITGSVGFTPVDANDTAYTGCEVQVFITLVGKKSWTEWSSLGGEFKGEACAGGKAENMSYYTIDKENSTIIATGGNCLVEGKYAIEQRPDPEDNNTPNYGAHVGIGGANWDSDTDAIGLSTWGWITEIVTDPLTGTETLGDRLYIMDFNFLIDECKEIEEECKDCEGNVTELTLQYNGTEDAYIEVKTKDEGVNGSKIVFEGNVGPGDQFTINGNDENGTFGDEIKVYVDGDYVKIKTDCSEDIGPGLIFEDIEVISGKSSNGAYLCPKVCDECEGKVNNLTLQYNGAEDANIRVETKKDGENGEKVVFEGMVEAGAEFSFVGNDKKGTLGTEITIYVNDVVNTKIHTSCSQPIGPGLMSGDFEVISGSSRDGGDLCPVDTPPGGDCDECKGGVTSFTVEYTGIEDATLKVMEKDVEIFNAIISPGQLITLSGTKDDGKFEENNLVFTLNGNVLSAPEHDAGKIHVSCSDPFYVGLPIGDSLVVTAGTSKDNGPICEDTPPGGGDDCNECDGKVTRLDLIYNGNNTVQIDVVQEKDDISVFSKSVNPGETFSFSGMDDKGTLGTEIIIYVNYQEAQRIHTSCSDPIGAGSVFGDFTVLSGASLNGGEFCPVDTPPTGGGDDCGECDGKVTRLELQYSGSGTDSIKIVQKKDGDIVFNGTTNGNPIEIFGEWKKGTFGTELIIYVNGSESQRIHTSCSVPIGEGSVFGDFTVLSGASLNGGEFCNTEGPS